MVKLTRLQFIFESQFCWYYSLVCGPQGNPTKVLWIAVVTLHVWYGIPEHVHDIPVNMVPGNGSVVTGPHQS